MTARRSPPPAEHPPVPPSTRVTGCGSPATKGNFCLISPMSSFYAFQAFFFFYKGKPTVTGGGGGMSVTTKLLLHINTSSPTHTLPALGKRRWVLVDMWVTR